MSCLAFNFFKLLINDSIFCALLYNTLFLLNLKLLIIIQAFRVPIFILFFFKLHYRPLFIHHLASLRKVQLKASCIWLLEHLCKSFSMAAQWGLVGLQVHRTLHASLHKLLVSPVTWKRALINDLLRVDQLCFGNTAS